MVATDKTKEQVKAKAKAVEVEQNSERKTVIVTRKFGEQKHKIFVSTVITKKGRAVLEQFRVPVEVEVDLPVEIIAALKQRGIAKFVNGTQKIVREFTVEAA